MSDVRERLKIDLTGAGFRDDEAISVGRRLYSIGVGVVRWDHSNGLDGYAKNEVCTEDEDRRTGKMVSRLVSGRRHGKTRPLSDVRQFVVHHSGGDGPDPRQMYETLHNRGLSCHFAVEDGGQLVHGHKAMIWQMLDVSEVAWHAGKANAHSVGAECALVPDAKARPHYYDPSNLGRRQNLPHAKGRQIIQGRERLVYMMPDPQIMALAKLVAGVWTALRLRGVTVTESPRFPRDNGDIPTGATPGAMEHRGMVGHYHLTPRKWDPAGLDLATFEKRVAQECRQMWSVVGGE